MKLIERIKNHLRHVGGTDDDWGIASALYPDFQRSVPANGARVANIRMACHKDPDVSQIHPDGRGKWSLKKGHHPLQEIIAKKLSGAAGVPNLELERMIDRACNAAVKYHKIKLEGIQKELDRQVERNKELKRKLGNAEVRLLHMS